MFHMKKYIEPKIKAVELDPDQAILQVCMVGGVYLSDNVTDVCMATGGLYSATCNMTPKGATTSITLPTLTDTAGAAGS